MSGQKDRIDRARLKLFKSILDRGGKANDFMVERWGDDSGSVRKVEISLGRFSICENEVEEIEFVDLERCVKEHRFRIKGIYLKMKLMKLDEVN